ncbi:PREDICTED: protein CREG1 [Tarenaya hassleriana]|uniref:protein CREG1 n=1 Tax=Tarenaya hassleriana TaxID=28532 RepID=UPI00053C8410|nr:PREDICTED: protein CREG1 [Tarenaya hassleriana]
MEFGIRLRSVFSVVVFLLYIESSAYGRVLSNSKPDRKNVVASARWLVAENTWGVLSTVSGDLRGAPWGNVVSFSDGIPGKGTGIPYFYLTTLDVTARNALKDPRASLAISEKPIGTCTKDPMDPTCAKLTLTGKLLPLKQGSEEAKVAEKALFAKHPEMIGWPKSHDFQFFKLEICHIFLLNWYGGPKLITVQEYLNAKPIKPVSSL